MINPADKEQREKLRGISVVDGLLDYIDQLEADNKELIAQLHLHDPVQAHWWDCKCVRCV